MIHAKIVKDQGGSFGKKNKPWKQELSAQLISTAISENTKYQIELRSNSDHKINNILHTANRNIPS